LLKYASELNFNLCLIDLRASGNSEGSYCTLGIKEYQDIYNLIKILQSDFNTKRVLLYGRSMGAVSIMKFISEYHKGNHHLDKSMPRVHGVILDSPFWTVQKFFNNFLENK
jgi:pimeloyl-ACP methyl ester carboxylesterase